MTTPFADSTGAMNSWPYNAQQDRNLSTYFNSRLPVGRPGFAMDPQLLQQELFPEPRHDFPSPETMGYWNASLHHQRASQSLFSNPIQQRDGANSYAMTYPDTNTQIQDQVQGLVMAPYPMGAYPMGTELPEASFDRMEDTWLPANPCFDQWQDPQPTAAQPHSFNTTLPRWNRACDFQDGVSHGLPFGSFEDNQPLHFERPGWDIDGSVKPYGFEIEASTQPGGPQHPPPSVTPCISPIKLEIEQDVEGDDALSSDVPGFFQVRSWPANSHKSNAKVQRDEYLIEARRRGMSYKEIKHHGKYAEAESTLRGRYRTLTKEKRDRVRKPVWHQQDCDLLQQAVCKFVGIGKFKRTRNAEEVDRLGVPWKQVGDFIKTNGGSYPFAAATCKKKFLQLLASNQS